MEPTLSRRRFVGISAAAAGLALVPFGQAAHAGASLVTWRGQTMGAVASLQIHHHDHVAAGRLIERAVAEARRLEQVFSLYRDDSALVTLNRHGVLIAPPKDLIDLLAECRRYFELTYGAFDPTVQALWTLYQDHFSQPGADPQGPSQQALQDAQSRVGFDRVAFSRDRIAFPRGTALTLNGIAQGYVTDRIVGLLRAEGLDRSIVDMGESRAIGARPDGTPWRIGIVDPDDPSRIAERVDIVDQAVATSGGYGFRFDGQGRFNHLFDPRTGASAHRYRSVTTVMPTATAADALSTAFSMMSLQAIENALQSVGHGRAHLVTAGGFRMIVERRLGPT